MKFHLDGLTLLEQAVPNYESAAGWSESLEEIRAFDRLPKAARDYVLRLEKLCGVPIGYIGVGKARDALIRRS